MVRSLGASSSSLCPRTTTSFAGPQLGYFLRASSTAITMSSAMASGVVLGLKYMLMFPTTGHVIAPEIGYVMGF